MVDSVVVVGALIRCTLLHSVYIILKATQVNVQCNLILELMLFEFKLGYNTSEATKSICCAKDDGAVDRSTVNRWFKKLHSDCKNLDEQEESGRFKIVDSEAML